MKRTDPVLLGDLLAEFVSMKHRMVAVGRAEGQAKDVWRAVAGDFAAKYTEDVFLKGGTLYLTISSSSARNAIHMSRRYYIDKMNEMLGDGAVRRMMIK